MKVKLTDLCNIQYGYAFDSRYFTDDESYIPLVRIRDVKRGFSETYYSEKYPEEYILHAGDLLIGMDGEFNIARWKSRDALLNQRVCKVSAKEGTCEEYLRFALSKELKAIENRTAFVTVKHLSAKELNKLELDVPELIEQEKIAEALDKIEIIIDKRRSELEKLDELIKARFVELFDSFDKVELCTVADITMGQSPDSSSYNDNGRGTPFFQGKADYGDKYTVVRHWTDKPTKSAKRGDVLMSVRAPVGPVNIPSVDCCIGRGLCSINAHNNKTNNEFLYNALKTIETEIASMGTGSTFKAITKNDVYSLMIPNVPFDLQETFSAFAQQVDKSKYRRTYVI